MKLFLFTNYFPLKRSEPFLVNEFEITKQYFESITLMPLCGNLHDYRKTESNTEVLQPPLKSDIFKFNLLLRGIFNLTSIKHHAADFFHKRIYLRREAFYWHIISLLI